jgi:mitogen-activated protein kinase organizer 1
MRALHQEEEHVSSSLPRIPVARLSGHVGPVQAVTFTLNDGKHCLTAGSEDRCVKLWNPHRVDPGGGGGGGAAAGSGTRRGRSEGAGGRSSSGDIEYEDLPLAFLIQTYTGGITHEVSALCVATSRLMLAASHKALVVTDMVENKVLRRLGGGGDHHTGRINAVASADEGEAYLTASYDASVAIWDGRSRDTKPIQILRDAKDSVTDVHVAQATTHHPGQDLGSSNSNNNLNSAIVRTASVDGVIRSYDLRKGMVQCDDLGSPITSICPTHDGQCIVASCLDGTIRLIEAETGELLNTYHTRHTAGQFRLDVKVLADDATILTGSEDGKAVLYDLVRANPVQVLEGPVRPACTVAAHPKQSDVVVVASYDNRVTVWANNTRSWEQ